MTFNKFSAANTAASKNPQDNKSAQGGKHDQQAKPMTKPAADPAAAPAKVEPAPKS